MGDLSPFPYGICLFCSRTEPLRSLTGQPSLGGSASHVFFALDALQSHDSPRFQAGRLMHLEGKPS